MNLFGFRIIKESNYQKNKVQYIKSYTNNMIAWQEQYDTGFRDGIQHVFVKIEEAVKNKNINKVLSISGATTEQLKLLVNALLGKFVKRSNVL